MQTKLEVDAAECAGNVDAELGESQELQEILESLNEATQRETADPEVRHRSLGPFEEGLADMPQI